MNKTLLTLASATVIIATTYFLAHADSPPKAEAQAAAEMTAPAENGTPATEAATSDVEEKAADEAPVKTYSPGMQVPVDGTSLKAFDASLEKIKEDSTESEYISLTGAIDYLLVYDLSAKRNRTKLAANLNGLTGAEIIAWVEKKKGRGKSGKKR